ncbi:MAG TPA: HAD-IA family hydrolase [Rhizomicrobium sp.]|jgi:phosphoglycolate phosphatase|nr:HAD-IA family hydrolase [Rhizomicrobium sp.]
MASVRSLALVFDLDGTLVDTAPDLLGATNAVLETAGRPDMDTASLRHMVGFGARSLISQAMASTGAPVEDHQMDRLVEIFIAHYRAHIADFSRPFPGVAETLKSLRADGARLGVLTNKPAELTGLLLERLELSEYFVAIYGAGRKTYTKPDPRIFHDVVLDLFAGEGGAGPAVMIGDSITDLATARAAGAPCILMSYGYTPVPASELGSDMVLDAFVQLPEALKSLAL